MALTRPVGQGASSRKYDVLTALGSYALSGDKHRQRSILRLITLITARYNWTRDELCVGQSEIARLWHCDERTVKREMARLRGLGWLIVRRAGARGRVTRYSLDLDAVLVATRPVWAAIGPDFDQRLSGPQTNVAGQGGGSRIVPLPVRGTITPPDLSAGTEWALAQGLLHAADPAAYAAWMAALARQERAGHRLILRAPSRFHAAYAETHLKARMLEAVQGVDDEVTEIMILA
jgi:hypothetical protein